MNSLISRYAERADLANKKRKLNRDIANKEAELTRLREELHALTDKSHLLATPAMKPPEGPANGDTPSDMTL